MRYSVGDWPAEARRLAGGNGVDEVIDSVGSTWADSLRCLRRGGRAVVFGATGGASVQLDVRQFDFGQFSLLGTTMGSPRDFMALLDSQMTVFNYEVAYATAVASYHKALAEIDLLTGKSPL